MSVVAVKVYDKEIIMSADSIIVHGEVDKTPVGRGKIFEVNGMLIGTSGLASEGIHMALFAENHTPLSMDDRELTKYMHEFTEISSYFDIYYYQVGFVVLASLKSILMRLHNLIFLYILPQLQYRLDFPFEPTHPHNHMSSISLPIVYCLEKYYLHSSLL